MEEANKLTILKVRDAILKDPPMEPLGRPKYTREEDETSKDEDDFFKKLQDLENQRSIPVRGPTPLTPLTPPQPSAPQQVPSTPAPVVYVTPPVARPQKPIIINGADRMWEYFRKRSTLVWNGQLPPNTASVNVVALMIPSVFACLTPIVCIEISGAAGNSVEALCTRRDSVPSVEAGPLWDTWIPCSDFAQLKALACPWTITLCNHYHEPLELGEDAFSFTNAVRLQNGNIKLMFDTPVQHMISGMCLRIITKNNQCHTAIVVHYDDFGNAAEVKTMCDVESLPGSKILNLHLQPTVILALSS